MSANDVLVSDKLSKKQASHTLVFHPIWCWDVRARSSGSWIIRRHVRVKALTNNILRIHVQSSRRSLSAKVHASAGRETSATMHLLPRIFVNFCHVWPGWRRLSRTQGSLGGCVGCWTLCFDARPIGTRPTIAVHVLHGSQNLVPFQRISLSGPQTSHLSGGLTSAVFSTSNTEHGFMVHGAFQLVPVTRHVSTSL